METIKIFHGSTRFCYEWTPSTFLTSNYNADNELITQISSTDGETDNNYDANGSLISSTAPSASGSLVTTSYQYGVRNRLISVSDNGAIAAAYTYDDAGNRVMESADGTTMQYLIDGQNPTGYDQTLVVRTYVSTLPQTVRTGFYVIGNTILGQRGTLAYPGAQINNGWYLFDAQGQTKALLTTSGAGNEYFNYDAFGLALNFNPQSNYFWVNGTVSNVLSTDSVYDPYTNLLLNGDGVRDRTPGSPDFMQRDPTSFAPGDIANSDLYLYVHGNPVSFNDPSGHDGDIVSLEAGMSIEAGLMAIVGGGIIAAGLSELLSSTVARAAVSNLATELLEEGGRAATALYNTIAVNGDKVASAINDAYEALIQAGKETLQQLKNYPIFPVIESFGPAVYKLDVRALASNPDWYVLNYNGPLSPVTIENRNQVRSENKPLLASAQPGQQLDEYPYASTQQGGKGAETALVPAIQNQIQGGLLSAFYRYSLKSIPESPFLVVPVPI